jgi:glycosyltransferase involved in cell wall biosynthesis
MAHDSPDIALYLPDLATGGAEMAMLRIAEGLAADGRSVDLVLATAEGGLVGQVPHGVRLVDLRARRPVLLTKTAALARYLRRERPRGLIAALDVVATATVARRIARTPTRVILSVQTNLSQQFLDRPDRGIRRGLVRALYPRTPVLVAASKGVADDVARMAGLDARRIHVIPNPVVTADLDRRAAAPVDHPFFAPGQPPVIIGVGRLVRQKDFATLVEAFALLRRRIEARLVILGGGDPREPETETELRALIERTGLAADVALPGWVSDAQAWMARADVFALSSIYEGFGNVVAEALAVGTPVVATDCESGPAEILEGGRHGRLVPLRDPQALADGIEATLASPPDDEALKSAAARYRTDRIAEQYLHAAGLSG